MVNYTCNAFPQIGNLYVGAETKYCELVGNKLFSSKDVDSPSADKEFSNLLWNRNVHY
jgi:hypothetical protein